MEYIKSRLKKYNSFASYYIRHGTINTSLFMITLLSFLTWLADIIIEVVGMINIDSVIGMLSALIFGLSLLIQLILWGMNVYSIKGLTKTESRTPNQVNTTTMLSNFIFTQHKQIISYDPYKNPVSYQHYLWSPDFNVKLRTAQISILYNHYGELITRKYIKEHYETLRFFLYHRMLNPKLRQSLFYNAKLLCLSGLSYANGNIDMRVNKGCYFDYYLTNLCYKSSLKHSQSIIAKYETTAFCPAEAVSGSINTSYLANVIGVSTLAQTNDGYVFIMIQQDANEGSHNMLAPSGSGSCDYKDWVLSNSAPITNAMQRELYEECCLSTMFSSYKDIGDTKLIAFFQWVEKAWKPDFLGITRLKISLQQLQSISINNLEMKKEIYLPTKLSTVMDLENYIESIYNIKTSEDHDGISLPLLLILKSLREMLMKTESKQQLKEFWNLT